MHLDEGQGAFIGDRFSQGDRLSCRQEYHEHDAKQRSQRPLPQQGRTTGAGVPGVEKMPDHTANQQNECDHQPPPGGLACKQKGVMGTDHQQQHRQGQVIVVQRPLFGLLPESGSRLLACFEVCNDLFLVGDNDEEHVGRHDGANDRAHV